MAVAFSGPIPTLYSNVNRKCWEMQPNEDTHWEFQPSSIVVLSCCILVHMCVRWNARMFYEGMSYDQSLFCSRVHTLKCQHDIQQQSSFMSHNVVKNNGNKEAQSHMVMRLYSRVVAASVWNSELFSVVVIQKMSAWTGGYFSQAGKEVLWL